MNDDINNNNPNPYSNEEQINELQEQLVVPEPQAPEEPVAASPEPVAPTAPAPTAPVYRETVKEKKKVGFGKKAAAVILGVTLGAGALGFGAGAGYKLINPPAEENITVLNDTNGNYHNMSAAELERLLLDFIANQEQGDKSMLTGLLAQTGLNSVAGIVNQVSNSVVSITTTVQQYGMFNQVREGTAAGSGIIFKEDESKVYIVTNYHVIQDATAINISLDDETVVPAKLVGGYEENDIAIITAAKSDMISAGIADYSIAKLADSDTIQVGDAAIAIGNALGEGKSATMGIISAIDINRTIQSDSGMPLSLSLIQTDAAINLGNSGGALVNANGEVIGINTAKLSSYGVEGMGYAIPSNDVSEMIERILDDESNGVIANGETPPEVSSEPQPYIGISMATITEEIRRTYGLPATGVYVNQVVPGSPAERAGIVLEDIITALDGERIETREQLAELVQEKKVGDTIVLSITRLAGDIEISVIVGDRNAN